MFKYTLLPLVSGAVLAFSGVISAVELVNIDNAPSKYVKKVTVKDPITNEESEKYYFGDDSVIWVAESLNRIFEAYGLEFNADNIDEMPNDYCRLVGVENEDGELEQVMKFNDDEPIIWEPKSLDLILAGYEVSLDQKMIADLPFGYATLVDITNENGETEKVVKFGTDHTVWTPNSFNTILAAYN